jgi:hypothetical protein
LRHDASTTALDEIRSTLKTGNRLNVGQLVYLIENPGGLARAWEIRGQGEAQLAELDNPTGQVAPREIAALILDAFEKQPGAIGRAGRVA